MTEHTDKVQIVKWNKTEESVLLTGSFDNTLKLYDVRSEKSAMTISIPSPIECCDWSTIDKYNFISINDV